MQDPTGRVWITSATISISRMATQSSYDITRQGFGGGVSKIAKMKFRVDEITSRFTYDEDKQLSKMPIDDEGFPTPNAKDVSRKSSNTQRENEILGPIALSSQIENKYTQHSHFSRKSKYSPAWCSKEEKCIIPSSVGIDFQSDERCFHFGREEELLTSSLNRLFKDLPLPREGNESRDSQNLTFLKTNNLHIPPMIEKNKQHCRFLEGKKDNFSQASVINRKFDDKYSNSLTPFVKMNSFRVPYPWAGSLKNDSDYISRKTPEVSSFVSNHPVIQPQKHRIQRKREKKKSMCVNISIWEEFYYGKSILDKKDGMPTLTSLSAFLFKKFRGIIPLLLIDFLVISAFLCVFFISCLTYNMFWELLCFYFLEKHLSLHEKADEMGIKLKFTGNAFQGPAYIYIRQVWCAHCAHNSSRKITTKFMDTYRKEMMKKREKL